MASGFLKQQFSKTVAFDMEISEGLVDIEDCVVELPATADHYLPFQILGFNVGDGDKTHILTKKKDDKTLV